MSACVSPDGCTKHCTGRCPGDEPRACREWTVAELHALHARRVAGERTDDLAAEVGVTRYALRHAWRRVGLVQIRVYDEQRVAPDRDATSLRAYVRHEAGETWEAIRDDLAPGVELLAFRSRVRRWRARAGIERAADWKGGSPAALAQRNGKRRRPRGEDS